MKKCISQNLKNFFYASKKLKSILNENFRVNVWGNDVLSLSKCMKSRERKRFKNYLKNPIIINWGLEELINHFAICLKGS